MHILRTLGVLTVVLAMAAPQGAASDDRPVAPDPTKVLGDGVIVPGQRVGLLRLGMSVDQILHAMPPTYTREVFAAEGIVLYEWRAQGIWVSLDARTQAVRLISAFGFAPYKTDAGVYLMHPEARMRAAYGPDARRYDYPDEHLAVIRYVALGLQFAVVQQPDNPALHSRIFTIGIFSPGHEPALVRPPPP
jgi:hypothetical protein